MKNDASCLNFISYTIVISTIYALVYALLFLEQYCNLLFIVLGVLMVGGAMIWGYYMKGKTGSEKGYTALGLMIIYLLCWMVLLVVLLVFEMKIAMTTIENWCSYRSLEKASQVLLLIKASPVLLLALNLFHLLWLLSLWSEKN